jgi:hypothetical protein
VSLYINVGTALSVFVDVVTEEVCRLSEDSRTVDISTSLLVSDAVADDHSITVVDKSIIGVNTVGEGSI